MMSRNEILTELAVLRAYLDKFHNQPKDESVLEIEEQYYMLLEKLAETEE